MDASVSLPSAVLYILRNFFLQNHRQNWEFSRLQRNLHQNVLPLSVSLQLSNLWGLKHITTHRVRANAATAIQVYFPLNLPFSLHCRTCHVRWLEWDSPSADTSSLSSSPGTYTSWTLDCRQHLCNGQKCGRKKTIWFDNVLKNYTTYKDNDLNWFYLNHKLRILCYLITCPPGSSSGTTVVSYCFKHILFKRKGLGVA